MRLRQIFVFGFCLFAISCAISCASPPRVPDAQRGIASDDQPGPVFSPDAVAAFTLKAPFIKLFSMIQLGGGEEAEIPEVSPDQEPRVPGRISYEADGKTVELPVEVVVRGQSSKADCAFRKLKLKFDENDVKGTVFEGNKTINLGTHCDDPSGVPGMGELTYSGRIADERGPIRESLAYELLHVAEVASPATRLVKMRYIDPEQGTDIQRAGFFLEDNDRMAKRLGGKRVKDWAKSWTLGSTEQFKNMDMAEIANVLFGEALLGNEDLTLALPSLTGPHFNPNPEFPFWNLYVVRQASGHELFAAYDFDFSTIVTGHGLAAEEPPRAFESFTGLKDYGAWIVFHQLQRTRSYFKRAVLDATIQHFLDKRAQLETTIAGYPMIDDAGRAIFKNQLAAFYMFLEKQFYVPVNTTVGKAIYFDEKKKKFCLAQDGPPLVPVVLLPGMPAKVIKKSGNMQQVQFLDVRQALQKQTEIGNCVDEPVWVDAGVKIDAVYPLQ